MSSDALRKVVPGEKLRIPAPAYNAFVDAALDLRRRQQNAGAKVTPAAHGPQTVLVRNNTGGDLAQFSVVAIGVPLITPTDNLNEFYRVPPFAAALPAAATDVVAILQEPIAAGKCGEAMLTGVTAALLTVTTEGDQYAKPAAASGRLVTGQEGPWRVVYAQAGTGSELGVVMSLSAWQETNGPDANSNRGGTLTFCVQSTGADYDELLNDKINWHDRIVQSWMAEIAADAGGVLEDLQYTGRNSAVVNLVADGIYQLYVDAGGALRVSGSEVTLAGRVITVVVGGQCSSPCACPTGLADEYVIDFHWIHTGCNGSLVHDVSGPVTLTGGGCSWNGSKEVDGVTYSVSMTLWAPSCCWRIVIVDHQGSTSIHDKAIDLVPTGMYPDYAFNDCPYAWRNLSVHDIVVSEVAP